MLKELHESSYGILCITRENIDAPWINFEAGALSKTLDKSYVSPFLFDIKRSEVQGPLLQFQSTVCEKEDVRKLLESVNAHATDPEKLASTGLLRAFDVWWVQLEAALKRLQEAGPDATKKKGPSSRQEAVLEEILDLVRTQQKILRDPETLLPAGYIEYALTRSGRAAPLDSNRLDALHHEITRLHSDVRELGAKEFPEELKASLRDRVERVHDAYHRLDGARPRVRRPRPTVPENKGSSE